MRSRSEAARSASPKSEPSNGRPMQTFDVRTGKPEPMEGRPSMEAPKAAASQASSADAFERIVRTVFDVPDPHAVFLELREGLSNLKPSRSDYGSLVDELGLAEDRAQRAVELLVIAEVALEDFKVDNTVIVGALKERARQSLKADPNLKSKEFTETLVKETAATMFADEWRDANSRHAKLSGAVEAMRSLAERWKERARDLRAMVQTARGA